MIGYWMAGLFMVWVGITNSKSFSEFKRDKPGIGLVITGIVFIIAGYFIV